MSDTIFYMPGRVVLGSEAFVSLSNLGHPGRKPLLITGRTFARRTGLLDNARKILTAGGIAPEVFDQVEPEPSIQTVETAADHARSHAPMRCIVEVDEPIEVSPERQRAEAGDSLMQQIEDRLRTMLAELSRESRMM